MKSISGFECIECNKSYVKWAGYCNGCGSLDTISEIKEQIKKKINTTNFRQAVLLSNIEVKTENMRIDTYYGELNHVLGGGLIKGSIVLFAGMPGIGKSTILLQIANSISSKSKILYATTEESAQKIKLRAERLKISTNNNFFISEEMDYYSICESIESLKPEFVFLDSLQNIIYESSFLTNSIVKVKEIAHLFVEHSRKFNYTLVFTCHVTKDGSIAGPKALEHLVDVVLCFEGEEQSEIRTIYSTKNRFGSTNEIGFFIMSEEGIKEHPNPQNLLIENVKPTIGASISWYSEGSRSFLIEIQALLNRTKFSNPQRVINGIDHKQLILVCAVIEKYLKIPLNEFDIFCKISGSIRVKSSHIDLALAVAILSSYFNQKIKDNYLFSGEIGLSGNIISKNNIPKNLPMSQYGISKIISPDTKFEKSNIEYLSIENIYKINKLFI